MVVHLYTEGELNQTEKMAQGIYSLCVYIYIKIKCCIR